MDDLGGSRDAITFIIGGHGANQPIFDEDASMVSLRCVRMSKAKNLGAAGGLARRKMTEQEEPTQEIFHACDVSLHRRVVPRGLIPIVKAEKLGVKLTLRDHSVEDPPLLRRQDSLVPRVAEKVSLVTDVGRVISKVPRVEAGYNRGSVLVGVEEEEVFELRLKKLDLRPDKLAKVLHA
jgi:hypothetical protein